MCMGVYHVCAVCSCAAVRAAYRWRQSSVRADLRSQWWPQLVLLQRCSAIPKLPTPLAYQNHI
jgi:hypothetical protein